MHKDMLVVLIVPICLLCLSIPEIEDTKQTQIQTKIAHIDKSTHKREILTRYISENYKIDEASASEIVYHADMQSRLHKHNGLTLPLVLAVIAAESSFDKGAVSPTGAKGLMQLTKSSGKSTSMDVFTNIDSGTTHLSEYINQTGSVEKGVQAYNIGIGAFRSGGRSETYLSKVITTKKKFEKVLLAAKKADKI